jgi:hypothetical protein
MVYEHEYHHPRGSISGWQPSDRFEQSFVVLPWNNLRSLELSWNKFQGSLPIPPPALFEYRVSNNELTGEIPEVICNLTSLSVLDLPINYLSGKLNAWAIKAALLQF